MSARDAISRDLTLAELLALAREAREFEERFPLYVELTPEQQKELDIYRMTGVSPVSVYHLVFTPKLAEQLIGRLIVHVAGQQESAPPETGS